MMENSRYIPDPASHEHFTVTVTGEYIVIGITDKNIQFFNTSHILGCIEKVLADLQYPTTVIDLSNVENLDSSGVGLLITVHKLLRKNDRLLLLLNVSGPVMRIFELTKMTSFLNMFRSLDDVNGFLAGK